MHVALVEPEIAPNTGNIIRLCANTGTTLHLVKPLGFLLEDRLLRRAGLDYHDMTDMHVHESFHDLLASVAPKRWLAFTKNGTKRYDTVGYEPDDLLVFGGESDGLPKLIVEAAGENSIYLPMRPNNRSFNLSNAVAITVMEAWRQHNFA
jgi:tRNA (cytidine/uridine-2'-O-)-methyltransferase